MRKMRIGAKAAWLPGVVLWLSLGACAGSRSGAPAQSQGSTSHQTQTPIVGAARAATVLSDRPAGDGDEDGQVALEKARVSVDHDGDADSDNHSIFYDPDDEHLLDYGRPASASEARAAVRVVESYYRASARDRGTAVCRLLGMALLRTLPAEYGLLSGVPARERGSCAPVLTRLFARLHQQTAAAARQLKVGIVRVEGDSGRVLLDFEGRWPTDYTEVVREKGVWKMALLFYRAMP